MNIVKVGSEYKVAGVDKTFSKLPVGVYTLMYDPSSGFYLSEKEKFTLPPKLYGEYSIVDRWKKSFDNCNKNMGILLSGIKGSGKTITAQKFCIEMNLPVIIVNECFAGSQFMNFLTNPLLGRYILFIDEYEKIYPKEEDQIDLIQLMDGNYFTNICFLLTVNNATINKHLVNRLNRIKYRKHYISLEKDVIDEVVKDLLKNKSHAKSVYDFFDKMEMCTFDLLTNLIKEMNLFNQDAIECGKHFNLELESSYYNITEVVNNKEYRCGTKHLYPGFEYLEVERSDDSWKKEKSVKDKKGHPKNKSPYVEVHLDECKVEKNLSGWVITNESENYKFILRKMKNDYLIF